MLSDYFGNDAEVTVFNYAVCSLQAQKGTCGNLLLVKHRLLFSRIHPFRNSQPFPLLISDQL